MNVTDYDYHMTPHPTPMQDVPVNPIVVVIAAFFVVGLIFAFLYLWLSD